MIAATQRRCAPRPRRLGRRVVGAWGCLLVLVAAALICIEDSVAAAQSGGGGSPGPTLRLLEQTPWVRSGDVFAARVAVDRPPAGSTLEPTVFGALEDPAEVAGTARGDELGQRLEALAPVAVPVGAAGGDGVVVRLPVGPDEQGAGRLDLAPGVYPLALDLVDASGERRDRLVTHVVMEDPSSARRPVAVVVRLDQPFRMDAAGRTQLLGNPATLMGAVDQIRRTPSVPITLVATPGTLSALTSAGTAAATALRGLGTQAQIVNMPFASLPAGAWVAAGLDQPIIQQMDGGVDALTSAFGGPPTGTVWLLGPTDNPLLLRWLAARGVKAFLVPEDVTAGGEPIASAPGRGGRGDDEPPTTPFRLAQVDAGHVGLRAEHVGPSGGSPADPHASPAVEAYRLLARLSVGAVDSTAGTSVAADEPPDPSVLLLDDVSPAGLSFLSTVLGALGQDGPLAPMSVENLRLGVEQALRGGSSVPTVAGGRSGTAAAATSADADPTTRLESWALPERTPPDLSALGADLRSASEAVDSLAGAVGADDPTVARLHQAVLTMGSQDMSSPERHDLAAHAWATAQQALAGIDLGDDQPVTVTADRTNLPLTLHNGSARTLDVVVHLESTDLELAGPTSTTFRLTPGARVDVTVPVEISRAGDFRLRARVTSPDGRLQLAERVVTVRSTAMSGVGIFLSLGALAFLFGWWGRQIRRKRRLRQVVDTPVALPANPLPTPVPHPPVDEPVP